MASNGMADAITRALARGTERASIPETIASATAPKTQAGGRPPSTFGDVLSATNAMKARLQDELIATMREPSPLDELAQLGSSAAQASIAARHGEVAPTADVAMQARRDQRLGRGLEISQALGELANQDFRREEGLRAQRGLELREDEGERAEERLSWERVDRARNQGIEDGEAVADAIESLVPNEEDRWRVSHYLETQVPYNVNATNARRATSFAVEHLVQTGRISGRERTEPKSPVNMKMPDGSIRVVSPGTPEFQAATKAGGQLAGAASLSTQPRQPVNIETPDGTIQAYELGSSQLTDALKVPGAKVVAPSAPVGGRATRPINLKFPDNTVRAFIPGTPEYRSAIERGAVVATNARPTATGSSGLTDAQHRTNVGIEQARQSLLAAGYDAEDVRRMSQRATDTGRENPDFSPTIVGLVKKATQPKYGLDPDFEFFHNRYLLPGGTETDGGQTVIDLGGGPTADDIAAMGADELTDLLQSSGTLTDEQYDAIDARMSDLGL